MAFLDNSGDIILDAVLTDAGRKRMAEGNFRISKFALGDDEIDYTLYNPDATVPDSNILGTPILEAFTDNASGLKSKLLTLPTDLDTLYLPSIKLKKTGTHQPASGDTFYVAVDQNTLTQLTADNVTTGVMTFSPSLDADNQASVMVHQGIDNTEAGSPTSKMSQDFPQLLETQYIVEIDNLLGKIYSINNVPANDSYIDDDNIASYFFVSTAGTTNDFITEFNIDTNTTSVESPIAGPKGTKFNFKVKPTTNLQTNTAPFNQLGSIVDINGFTYQYIDTNVRIMGAQTGYRIDVPIRFLKLQ